MAYSYYTAKDHKEDTKNPFWLWKDVLEAIKEEKNSFLLVDFLMCYGFHEHKNPETP